MDEPNDQSFPLGDYAELLGAIYGDGHIQKRGKRSWKVSVAVSDRYPTWLAALRRLFAVVFGHAHERARRGAATDTVNYELYVTTKDLCGLFRIDGKYDAQHRIVPPAWIDGTAEYCRRFLRGLVETDGMFKAEGDARWSKDREWARFCFAQKCPHLSAWVQRVLIDNGFPASLDWREVTGTWQIWIRRQTDVARLGEWLDSYKWRALLAEGFTPSLVNIDRKHGQRVEARAAVVHKTIDDDEQNRWRELRHAGAAIGAIARHFSRSNSVVGGAVSDIVPMRSATARELALRPQPRIPRRISDQEVAQWRDRALAGESASAIARAFNRDAHMVVEATRDIAWDLETEALEKRKK